VGRHFRRLDGSFRLQMFVLAENGQPLLVASIFSLSSCFAVVASTILFVDIFTELVSYRDNFTFQMIKFPARCTKKLPRAQFNHKL
jgi:hypothetical protein